MSTVSFSFIPRTIRLLEDHSYFGLKKENVTIMKQNGVPALMNPECAIATKDDGHIIYEGEIHYGNAEYEFEIDAASGTILEWTVDYEDD